MPQVVCIVAALSVTRVIFTHERLLDFYPQIVKLFLIGDFPSFSLTGTNLQTISLSFRICNLL